MNSHKHALGRILCLTAALAALPSCVTTQVPYERDAAYRVAVDASASGEHTTAALGAFRYLQSATDEDGKRDRALRLLARSAEGLDLRYAASLWYLQIAEARRAPELLPEALRGLERIIMSGPHDGETLVRGYLATADLQKLPSDVQAFVDYQQGLESSRLGLSRWADAKFESLPENSPYHARAQYARAIAHLTKGRWGQTQYELSALLKHPALPEDVARQTRHTLARLALETGDYESALSQYEAVRGDAADDPALVLEMAWATFRKGDDRRTLGLLLALDAPVYQDLIAPERFLLEAMALRRLCQFGPARYAAVRLESRHGDALADLHAGMPPTASAALRGAATRHPGVDPHTLFRLSLERERAALDQHKGPLGDALYRHLVDLYDRGLAEAQRREEAAIAAAVPEVANALLESEEGVRLIAHELSVALLRGRRRPDGPPTQPAAPIPVGGAISYFNFDGEFWTDELDDLLVVVDDRCID